MYVFLQQDNTQNIKPEGQQGSEALTAACNKKCIEASPDVFEILGFKRIIGVTT